MAKDNKNELGLTGNQLTILLIIGAFLIGIILGSGLFIISNM